MLVFGCKLNVQEIYTVIVVSDMPLFIQKAMYPNHPVSTDNKIVYAVATFQTNFDYISVKATGNLKASFISIRSVFPTYNSAHHEHILYYTHYTVLYNISLYMMDQITRSHNMHRSSIT